MVGLIFQWVIHNSPMFSPPLAPYFFPFPQIPKKAHHKPVPTLNLTTLSPPGWRNQIPTLLSLSYRVVCPDLIGFGRTAAPPVPPNTNIEYYSFKRAASDINELARLLNCPTIILGGHDWVRDLISPPFFHSISLLQPSPYFLLSSLEQSVTPHLISGRSNSLPHLPLVSPSRLPHLRDLHPLQSAHPHLHPSRRNRDPFPKLELPTRSRVWCCGGTD